MSKLSPFVVPDVGGIVLKVDIINDAYSQMRISGITVQPTPDDLELALMRLEAMMASFLTRNVAIGYAFEDTPDPNTPSEVKLAYKLPIATNLAIRLIPDFNKQVPQTLMLQANAGLSDLSGSAAMERLNGVTYPDRMPRGSGNSQKFNRWSRFYRQYNTAINNAAQETMFIGDIKDFTSHFDSFMGLGEIISSYSITADSGLSISNDSNTDTDVSYRVEAVNPSTENTNKGQLLTIIVTTDAGQVKTKQIMFELVQRISDQ